MKTNINNTLETINNAELQNIAGGVATIKPYTIQDFWKWLFPGTTHVHVHYEESTVFNR